MPNESGSELQPDTIQIFEASAAAFPTQTLDRGNFQLLVNQTIDDLKQRQSIDPTVITYLTEILPNCQNPETISFSIRITDTQTLFGKPIQQEYILPILPFEKNEDPLEAAKQTDLHLPDAPELRISNLSNFIVKLNKLFITGMKNHDQLDPWFHRQGTYFTKFMSVMWYGATPHDFQNPEQYIERITNFMTQRPFEKIQKHPINIKLISGFTLNINNFVSSPDMEAPFELHPKLIPDQNPNLAPAGTLPSVRYGIEGKKAYICAVQMPHNAIPDSDGLKFEQQLIQDDSVLRRQFFTDMRQKEKDNFEKIFGEVPEEILYSKNAQEFVVKLFEHLNNTFPDLYNVKKVNYYLWIKSRLPDYFKTEQNMFNENITKELHYLKETYNMIKRYPDRVQIPKKRKQLMRTLFKLDDGLEPDTDYFDWKKTKEAQRNIISSVPPEYPEENLYDVPRHTLISVASSLVLFQKAGINEIVVPTYYPQRWEDHVYKHRKNLDEAERIHYVTTNTLIRIFRRIEKQIDGVVITELPDDDGFMRLKIDGTNPLSSNNKLLQEILESVNSYKL